MAAGLVLPPPGEPMAVARLLLAGLRVDGLLTLRSWRGGWTRWTTTHWTEAEPAEVRSTIYQQLENAVYVDNKGEVKPWSPTRHKVANVLEALAAVTRMSEATNPPAWTVAENIPAGEVVSCANGLLQVPTRKLARPTRPACSTS
jgi:putative DNA primase/helicase